MHWKSLIGFILIMCVHQLAAQEKGKVLVTKDPQIDSLIARRLELNRAGLTGNNVTLSGFRVQIFSGLDRQVAYSEQAKFKARYTGINTYISYTQPNYKLRVGDFRTRLEAEKLMNELKKYYTSMFIFSEMIILK
ncbi:SPOR domain-containing protein [Daejeonella sp.]|uniref:SPOR domain-containing protein n=1 Tax=Daejeonella sp. TaxID=2805397 RepID=UPI002724AC16|nr:SPOR domain-containing protein [Daejeonella sp.]MDO8992073.1 SPOR domain-containing protein [Daejeonella sp.]MDP2414373.1 SPOR domain-containing protein [Daejeonella sp.]